MARIADVASIPQTDEEETGPSARALPRHRAFLIGGALVPLLGLAALFVVSRGGISTHSFSEMVSLEGVVIPTLPPSPVDVVKGKLAEEREKWGINNLKKDQITLCVTNLNLGLWKLIQFAAVLAETTENCPGGFTNIDKKIACNINIAALVASMSAATSFLASTSFLCTTKPNPDAACTTVLGATMETFATYPAAENQIALFCPKNSYQQTVVEGGVRVFAADRRLRGLANSSASPDRQLYVPIRADYELADEPVELLFCSWQIAQTVWFFVRAGPLIEIATKVCPASPGGEAACSEVVNEVMLMFWNAAKFIAAATTNCVDGVNVAAGCALGSLNLISAFSSTAGVISALADGVCSNLGPRRRETKEKRINQHIRKIQLLRSVGLRRLLGENKLTGPAVAEASKLIDKDEAAQGQPDATVPELLRSLGLRTNVTSPHEVRELVLSHLQSLDPAPLEEPGRQQMMAKVHDLQAKHSSNPPLGFA